VSAAQKTPAPNPLIKLTITTAGYAVMKVEPTIYGSMAIRNAVAIMAHRKAKA
jgi:hypothetical protein